MAFASANAILRQPDKISYTLFDDKIRQDIIEGRSALMRKFPVREDQRKIARNTDTSVIGELKRLSKKGPVKIADSWEEIADWLGAEPRTLQSTVDEYNSFCEKGYDRDFAKDKRYLLPICNPPYYAVRTRCNIP